jgi:ribosomal protein L10
VRAQKEQTVSELADKLSRSQLVVVTDYRGLTVAEMSALRGRLRQAGAEYQVAKNTLTRFAAEQAGRAALVDDLTGPSAIAFGYEDPAALAKSLQDYLRAARNSPLVAFLSLAPRLRSRRSRCSVSLTRPTPTCRPAASRSRASRIPA